MVNRDEVMHELTSRQDFCKFTEEVFETWTDQRRIELRELAIAILKEKGKAPKPMVALCIGIGLYMLKDPFLDSLVHFG